ncbi:MAG: hypothetical protein ABW189_01660 [Rickettsiales bacterium]
MRRLVFLSLVCGCYLAGNPVLAAATGSVTITGSVPVACDIVVQTESGATGIADLSLGDTDRLVATVTEDCNDPDGYTVSLAGSNSGNHTGKFVDSVSADELNFTVKYNGVQTASGGVVTDSNAPANAAQKPVRITYAADPTLTGAVGNTYQETLTFSISAK